MTDDRSASASLQPRRVLFIAEGQLGDLLILTPALRAFKETYPDSSISVLVLQRRWYESRTMLSPELPLLRAPAGGTSVVLINDPHVDHVVEINRQSLRSLTGFERLKAEASVVLWLRKERFDVVICTFPQDRFSLWAFLSGARIRVGEAGRGMSFLLNRAVAIRKEDGGVLGYYCGLAAAAGAPARSYETRFVIPDNAQRWADERLGALGMGGERSIVAVHPGASAGHRIWPPESFASVIDAIQQRHQLTALLCGGVFDRPVVDAIRARCKTQVAVIIVEESVSHLAALLRRSVLCLSNNSGPRHLAIAVGTPSLAVIPRFDDAEWKIYPDESRCGTIQSAASCPACGTEHCRNIIPPGEETGSLCMRAVTPDSVLARIDAML